MHFKTVIFGLLYRKTHLKRHSIHIQVTSPLFLVLCYFFQLFCLFSFLLFSLFFFLGSVLLGSPGLPETHSVDSADLKPTEIYHLCVASARVKDVHCA